MFAVAERQERMSFEIALWRRSVGAERMSPSLIGCCNDRSPRSANVSTAQ